jgi:hypothetical protein
VTATDVVVAKEITRLRTKERENKIILPPNCSRGLSAAWSVRFPISWKSRLGSGFANEVLGATGT